MSEPPPKKATSQNVAALPSPELLDKAVLLIVSGLSAEAIEGAIGKWGIGREEAAVAIAEAKTRIQIAARYDRDEQLGTALVRLNDIYRRALASHDAKTALAVQRELNRLLDLYRKQPASKHREESDQAVNDQAIRELEEARAYLDPLGLGGPNTPLPELCRLAVLQMLREQTKEDDGDGSPERRRLRQASRARG